MMNYTRAGAKARDGPGDALGQISSSTDRWNFLGFVHIGLGR
ncbi:hypothetical protein ACVWWO_001942 [Bradyrhizobium sp. F1.13.1]